MLSSGLVRACCAALLGLMPLGDGGGQLSAASALLSGPGRGRAPDALLDSSGDCGLNIQRTPLAVVALGSKEAAHLEGSRAFVEARRRRGARAELIMLEGLGHDGTALAMGDGDSALVVAMLRMVAMRCSGAGPRPDGTSSIKATAADGVSDGRGSR